MQLPLDALPCVCLLPRFFRHLAIAILNVSTMAYELGHRNKTTVIISPLSPIIPVAHGFNIRELSTAATRIKPKRFFFHLAVGELVSQLDRIGSTMRVPPPFRVEVYIISFHVQWWLAFISRHWRPDCQIHRA